jgi:hypothetical protein
VLNEGEVKQILAQPATEGSVKVVVVKPGRRVAIDEGAVAGSGMELEVMPVGQGWQVGLYDGRGPSSLVPAGGIRIAGGGAPVGDAASQLNSNAMVAAAPVLVASGQGAVMTMAMSDAISKGTDGEGRLSFSSAAAGSLLVSGSVTSMTNSVSSSQVLLLPVTPPEGTAP